MQFLRTAFWVAVAVLAVLFSMNNWTPVQLVLWGGLIMETKLPVLLGIAFLIGALPVWIYHRATKWRLKRRLDTAERALALPVVTPSIIQAPTPALTEVPA